MTIKELKRKFKFRDQDVAQWFGYKNPMSYANAKNGKSKTEQGLVAFYNHMIDAGVIPRKEDK